MKHEITKAHFERVNKGLDQPFKINSLDFESVRKELLTKVLSSKIQATSMAKLRFEDTKQKNELIRRYKETYGVVVPPRELNSALRQVDLVGLELILKKKLADNK